MICTFVLSLNPASSSCRWDLLTSASSSVWRWYMAFRGQSHSSPTGFLLLELFTSHLSTEGHLPDALTDHHSFILDSGSEPPLVSGYSLAALDLRWNPPCYYIISYTFLFYSCLYTSATSTLINNIFKQDLHLVNYSNFMKGSKKCFIPTFGSAVWILISLSGSYLMIQSHQRKMNTAQRRSRAYVQLINSKVSGCCLVVCEQCACLSLRLTHQASLSSIFSSTSPLPLCHTSRSLIFIHSDLTFQLESSPSPTTPGDCWKRGGEGWKWQRAF